MPSPLHYITVTTPDGEIIGYAWGSADDVGWVHRAASSSDAYRAGVEWYSRIRDAHRRGLAPAGVLAPFSREPGVGPVTEAPDLAAVEELARVVTPADDQRLLDQLVPAQHPAWRWLAEAFDALTAEDREVVWGGGHMLPSGAIQAPFPVYSKQVERVVSALHSVGAVTEEYRWMGHPLPTVPSSGHLSPADAVRAATALVRGERFCNGLIDEALRDGLLDAVVGSLRAWHAELEAGGSSAAYRAEDRPEHRPEEGSARTVPAAAVRPSVGGARGARRGPVRCRYCGGSPAVDAAFRAHRGLLVLLGFRRMDGPVCRTCGLGLHRALTTHTLCWGWWSPLSLVLFGPLTLVRNLLAVRRVKRLAEPGPGLLGPRFDPGVPVHRRPRAYVALVPLAWLLCLIGAAVFGGG
ncbi:DUF6508 domain-containing protein [Streptomyces mexicanus]|uniref:DUF6508 domain-containing protein n=1 Tax=Streptomyces mexicanus TaxID=178566 RepID=UPI00135C0902|nr:DUF6508 domain-containing protein [Streptomyces mexicanus]